MSAFGSNFQISISRYRGDTAPEEFILVDNNGAAIDIEGRSFVLTVNPVAAPVDDSNDVYQLAGVITDATSGSCGFPLSETQAAAAAGDYFFDIKMTFDLGAGDVTKTVAGGSWSIIQGIS